MNYLGDVTPGKTIEGWFNTRDATGAPITLAGTPSLRVYKGSSTTESSAGITLTVDFDARTGLHYYAIDTSADGTFYSAGANFGIVITAGTVDAISAVGHAVGSFSLSNRSALRPATADRTIAVTASGEVPLSAGERDSVADALLARNIAGGSSAGRTVKDALAFLRNKWTLVGTTLTVYDTDDTTVLWTATVTRTAGASPITGTDPT